MSEWTLSGTCNATCDGGIGNATRTVISQPRFGGAACPTNLFRTDFACNTQPCFQNCSVSEWTEYSNCSAACGTGTKYRNRTIVLPAYGGGTPCPALNETTSCLVTPCPVDCVVRDFMLNFVIPSFDIRATVFFNDSGFFYTPLRDDCGHLIPL